MKALWLGLVTLLALPSQTLAYDLVLSPTSNAFPIRIADRYGVALPPGQTLSTVDIKYECLGSAVVTLNETGATLTQDPAGRLDWYVLTTPATITCAVGKTLDVWAVGVDAATWTTRARIIGVAFVVVSSADCTNSATTFDTTLGSAYAGTNGPREAGIRFTSGALINEVRRIGGYSTNGCVSVNQAFSATPTANDAFVVVNQ